MCNGMMIMIRMMMIITIIIIIIQFNYSLMFDYKVRAS